MQVGTQPIAGPSSRTRDRLREVSVPRPAPRLYKAADRVADQGVALLDDELMIAARMPPPIAAKGEVGAAQEVGTRVAQAIPQRDAGRGGMGSAQSAMPRCRFGTPAS
jgi:hypothetical protein